MTKQEVIDKHLVDIIKNEIFSKIKSINENIAPVRGTLFHLQKWNESGFTYDKQIKEQEEIIDIYNKEIEELENELKLLV